MSCYILKILVANAKLLQCFYSFLDTASLGHASMCIKSIENDQEVLLIAP